MKSKHLQVVTALSFGLLLACGGGSDDSKGGDGGKGGSGGKASGGNGGKGGSGGTSSGGNAGKSGGSGGTSSGGNGGSANGGSGGTAAGGMGGTAAGGMGGTAAGGMGGTAEGGMGGTPMVSCNINKAAKEYKFDAPTDSGNWEYIASGGDRLEMTPANFTISATQKRGDTGSSLKVSLDTTGQGTGKNAFGFGLKNGSAILPYLQAGRTVKAWLWVPEGHPISLAFFVVHVPANGPPGAAFQNQARADLTANAWNEFSVTLAPEYDCTKLKGIGFVEVGFYLQLNPAGAAPWKGDIYVDDVVFQAAP